MAERIALPPRFWAKAERRPSGCWEWTGWRLAPPKGYGLVCEFGVARQAHRVAWELHHHTEIPDGLVVRHTCDNPPCVNPWHLRLGTQVDNIRDRGERGRTAVGEAVHTAKLSPEQVREIRSRYIPGMRPARRTGASTSELAKEFGVSTSAIWNLTSPRKSGWRWLR